MNNIGKKLHKDRDEILNFCNKHNRIFLYGAGFAATFMMRYLYEEEIEVEGIVVSDKKGEPDCFYDVQVHKVDDVTFRIDDGIILAVGIGKQPEIKDLLKRRGISDSQIYCQKIYVQYAEYYEKKYSDIWKESENGFFKNYEKLDKIGRKYGTDKSSEGHNYLNKYEFFLNRWKEKNITLLELGVYKGASINTWSEYFKNGIIYGVDINENCRIYEEDNKHIIIQDLGDEAGLERLGELHPQIIIDDASHYWSHQIKSLYHLIPALVSGGIFIMEDLNTSFAVHRANGYDDSIVSGYEFCSALARAVASGTYIDVRDLRPELVEFKEEIEELATQIEMMAFIHESCVIIKK